MRDRAIAAAGSLAAIAAATGLIYALRPIAPVLSLGLPTLVILNMADDLKSRGGGGDVG